LLSTTSVISRAINTRFTPLAGQSHRRLCRSLGCCFSCL
jgi:hypothetical protein